jgi:hypothetical protein
MIAEATGAPNPGPVTEAAIPSSKISPVVREEVPSSGMSDPSSAAHRSGPKSGGIPSYATTVRQE